MGYRITMIIEQEQLLGAVRKAIAAGDRGYVEKIQRLLTSIGDRELLAQVRAEVQTTEARYQFVEFLSRMVLMLTDVEGKLGLESQINDLNQKRKALETGVFRFLVLGDFNRGKSTILNVLLGQEILPIGLTPTTALPTFVRYRSQEKIKVCFKTGKVEELSLEEFKENYTFNSKSFKQKLKMLNKSVADFLAPIECAVFELPVKLLQEGIELIDTAGLNYSPEENEKTLSYIEKSHAVIFILSPLCFTVDEKKFLKTQIRPKVKNVFFLINGWEKICLEEGECQEIREEFTTQLSNSLNIPEEEVFNLWGKKIFDVYALEATQRLEKGESIEGTGFKEFTEAFNQFIERECFAEKLYTSLNAMNTIGHQVLKKIDEQLNNENKKISFLEGEVKIPENLEAERIQLTALRTEIISLLEEIKVEYSKYRVN